MHDRSVVEEYDTIALSELKPFHNDAVRWKHEWMYC